tara:strand:- start:19819 stop:20814 length:996 start_codon:yes stop_codon:yes gene_type:complete
MADTELSNPTVDGGTVASNAVSAEPVADVATSDAASGNIVEQVETAGTRDSAATSESESGTRGTNDAGNDEKPDRGFDLLTSDLPEDETFSLDGFYKGIKPEHLEKLDPLSKQVIHNLRRDYHNKRQRDSSKARELETTFSDRVQALKDKERALITRQKAFAKLIDDPKLKEVLSKPESELPDLLSPEGIEARIERAAAEKLNQLVKPIAEHSERETRRLALNDFVESHPEMKDTRFRGEVAELIRQRRASGFALSTPDAYELVRAQRGMEEQQRLQARQRQVRAASARQIGKSKANAAKTSGPPKGARAQEIYAWVKANQEEAKRLAGLK